MGYGYKSRWLTNGMLHLLQKATKTPSHIPAKTRSVFFALRLFASLNPRKFDFGRHLRLPSLRMTYSGFIWWYVLEKTAGDHWSPLQ